MADAEVPKTPLAIELSGYVFPWCDSAPVLLNLRGTDDFFLPLFSTVEKLQEMASQTALDMDAIKRIDDGPEFLDSVPERLASGQRLRIMVDPARDQNKTRWTEVMR